MEPKYLRNHEIDKERWDGTVRTAPGGSVYVFSWYLDAVCPGWEALATGDYSRIMPLTRRKKYGFHYLYQPLLSQQLGVISQDSIPPEEITRFISSIPRFYKLAEITLNRSNLPPEDAFTVSRHTTYRLSLSATYEDFLIRYSENTRRNLKKAVAAGLDYQAGLQPADFYRMLDEDRSDGSRILKKRKNKDALANLLKALFKQHAGTIHGARDRSGRLIATLLTAYSHHTHYYLVPLMNQEGRDSRAMFFLIDRIIQDHAGKPEVIDFEGSDIEGIARFYAGFGAQPDFYPSVRFNRLPWPVNRLADWR